MKSKIVLVPLLALMLLSGCNKKDGTEETNSPKQKEKKHVSFLEKDIPSAPMTDAVTNRKLTEEATAKEYQRILSSDTGKKAYTKLIDIFNTNISRIASQGYYDTFIVTFLNERKLGISEAFSGLNQFEQNYVRNKVIFDLEKKGYVVKHNEYWDNPESINISVSW